MPLGGAKSEGDGAWSWKRTWDCSPGHAGKDGPHLAMTEGSCVFPRAAAPVGVFGYGMLAELPRQQKTHSCLDVFVRAKGLFARFNTCRLSYQ